MKEAKKIQGSTEEADRLSSQGTQYPRSLATKQKGDTNMENKLRELQELEALKKDLEKEIERLKDSVKAEMEALHLEEVTAGGYKASWKEVFSNRIDSKALKAARPEVYDQFLSVNITRRFTLQAC